MTDPDFYFDFPGSRPSDALMGIEKKQQEALERYGTDVDKLRLLFEKYGQHLAWCHSQSTVAGMVTGCDCGFSDALAKVEAT